MKTVLAIVALAVACNAQTFDWKVGDEWKNDDSGIIYGWEDWPSNERPQESSPPKISDPDMDAVNALLYKESAYIRHLVPQLTTLIEQFRMGVINWTRFSQEVKNLLYPCVANRQNVDEFLWRIQSAGQPRMDPAIRYPPSGFSSSRVKGHTYVGTGAVLGDGGDIINSVLDGIIQSGGGFNGIVSSVKGTNNQGVQDNRGGDKGPYDDFIKYLWSLKNLQDQEV